MLVLEHGTVQIQFQIYSFPPLLPWATLQLSDLPLVSSVKDRKPYVPLGTAVRSICVMPWLQHLAKSSLSKYSLWSLPASVSGLKWRHLHFSPGEPAISYGSDRAFYFSEPLFILQVNEKEGYTIRKTSRAPDSRTHLISCLPSQVLWPKHWHAYLLINPSCNFLLSWVVVQVFSFSYGAIPPFSLTPRIPLKSTCSPFNLN